MLQPKRTKYRKAHKGRIHGKAKGGTALNFGAFGMKAVEPARVTARQIEAARRQRYAEPGTTPRRPAVADSTWREEAGPPPALE